MMTESKFETVRTRVESILVGMNVMDTVIVLMSLASSASAMILGLNREEFLEMCAEFYDKRTAENATRRRTH